MLIRRIKSYALFWLLLCSVAYADQQWPFKLDENMSSGDMLRWNGTDIEWGVYLPDGTVDGQALFWDDDDQRWGSYNILLKQPDGSLSVNIIQSGVDAVPDMTSNITPEGEVTYSTYYSVLYAYNAFDNNTSSQWATNISLGFPQWIAYEGIAPFQVTSYKIRVASSPSCGPKDFELQGWNGVSYDTIDTQTGIIFLSSYEEKTFVLSEPVMYQKYRLYVTATNTSGTYGVTVSDLQLISDAVYKEVMNFDSGGEISVFPVTGIGNTIFDTLGTIRLSYSGTRYTDLATASGGDILFTFTNDGTIVLSDVVWEDLNFDPLTSGGPPATYPDDVTINNVYFKEFTSSNNQTCGSCKEIPHKAYLGSAKAYPHAHIFLKSGESSGTTGVTFTVYWSLRQSSGVSSGSVALSATSAQLVASANKLDISDATGFTMPTALGGQLCLRIDRTGGDAGDVIVSTYGIHFPIDTMGSRGVATK